MARNGCRQVARNPVAPRLYRNLPCYTSMPRFFVAAGNQARVVCFMRALNFLLTYAHLSIYLSIYLSI